MHRRLLCTALVLATASCGSVGEDLPRPLAEQLADAADAIALSLEQEDACGADAQADELVSRVENELDDGSLPPTLGRELRRRATDLAGRIECPPPVVEDEAEEPEQEEGEDGAEEAEEEDEDEDSSGEGEGDSEDGSEGSSSGEGSGDEDDG